MRKSSCIRVSDTCFEKQGCSSSFVKRGNLVLLKHVSLLVSKMKSSNLLGQTMGLQEKL